MFWKEAVCHENTSGALYKTAERCYRVGRCECGTVRRTYLWIAWEKWIWKNDVYACSERIDECKRRKGVG